MYTFKVQGVVQLGDENWGVKCRDGISGHKIWLNHLSPNDFQLPELFFLSLEVIDLCLFFFFKVIHSFSGSQEGCVCSTIHFSTQFCTDFSKHIFIWLSFWPFIVLEESCLMRHLRSPLHQPFWENNDFSFPVGEKAPRPCHRQGEWIGCLPSTACSGITGPDDPAFRRYRYVLSSSEKERKAGEIHG